MAQLISNQAKARGFLSEREYRHLLSQLDIHTPTQMQNYRQWLLSDGTKRGLIRLMNKNRSSAK